MSAAAQLATRTGRHSLVYGTGFTLTVVAGMASLAVFTRLMDPEEYGEVAVLLALSGLATLLSTIGVIQGVLNAVFGAADDEADGGDLGEEDEDAVSVGRKREALGTGLVLLTCTGTVATVVVWLASGWLADRLLGDPDDAGAVQLAGLVAGMGAVWALLQAVPRLERRPRRYVGFAVARPVLALLAALPFVIEGDGARGVMLGLAISTAALLVVALVMMRHAFRLTVEAWVFPVIAKRGAAFVPYGLANWVMTHGGVLILTAGVSLSQLGFYRVALTLGNIILHAAAVFFMAWLPLKRTSLFAATRNERGHGWIGGQLTTWFTVGACGLFVLICVGATQLVRIAGPDFEEAADLMPLVAGAALAHAAMLLSYRVAAFPHKRLVLAVSMTLAALLFVGASLQLVDWLGTIGVPIAAIGAYAPVAVVFVVLGQRGRRPVDFEYGKLAVTAAVVAFCVGTDRLVAARAGSAGIALDFALVLAYPLLLLALRVITLAELRRLARVGRESMRPARAQRPVLLARLHALPTAQRQTLYRVAGPRPEREAPVPAGEEVAAALRAFGNGDAAPAGGAHDRAVGTYLASGLSRAERDAMARTLWKSGVDPAELDRLEETLEALRRLPPAAWGAGYAPPA